MSNEKINEILGLNPGSYFMFIEGYSADQVKIERMPQKGFKTIRKNGVVTYYNEQGEAYKQTCEAVKS